MQWLLWAQCYSPPEYKSYQKKYPSNQFNFFGNKQWPKSHISQFHYVSSGQWVFILSSVLP